MDKTSITNSGKYITPKKIKSALKYDIPIFIVLLILIIITIIWILIAGGTSLINPVFYVITPLLLIIILVTTIVHLSGGFFMFLKMYNYKKMKLIPEDANISSWWKASLLGFGYKHVMKEEYLDTRYKIHKLKLQKTKKHLDNRYKYRLKKRRL